LKRDIYLCCGEKGGGKGKRVKDGKTSPLGGFRFWLEALKKGSKGGHEKKGHEKKKGNTRDIAGGQCAIHEKRKEKKNLRKAIEHKRKRKVKEVTGEETMTCNVSFHAIRESGG